MDESHESNPAAGKATTQRVKVVSRNEPFVDKPATKIWFEAPSDDNPYIAKEQFLHGYCIDELMSQRSYVDVLYLLFRGELPNAGARQLFERLLIALLNPGPRHPATRAAMTTAVGKSDSMHILPVAATLLGGQFDGAADIANIMKFLCKNSRNPVSSVVKEHRHVLACGAKEGEHWEPLPGFGQRFGSVEQLCEKRVVSFLETPGNFRILNWAVELVAALSEWNIGWLITGVAAAAFADLGFQPKTAAALFQLLRSPGALAHGLEFANKPRTAMPFVKDECYDIES